VGLYIGPSNAKLFEAGSVSALSVSNLTLAFWLKAETHQQGGGGSKLRIFRHAGATNGYYEVSIDRTGTADDLRLSYAMATSAGSGNVQQMVAAESHRALDGIWHRVVVQHESDSRVWWWVDGRQVQRGNPFRALGYSGAVTSTIGGSNDIGKWAKVSDLRIYNRFLNAAEIGLDAAGGMPGGLIGRYLIGGLPNGWDYSGRGNHLRGTEDALDETFTGCEDAPVLQFATAPRRWWAYRTVVGAASGSSDLTATPTGVAATAELGTLGVSFGASLPVSGIEATAALGTPQVAAGATLSPAGVSAAAALGAPTVAAAASLHPSGIAATAALGTPVVEAGAGMALTGVAATTALGSLIWSSADDLVAALTGVQADAALGTLVVTGGATMLPSGVAAVAALGSPTWSADGNIAVTLAGVEAITALGPPTFSSSITLLPTGVSAAAALGIPVVSGSALMTLLGVSASAQLGTLVFLTGDAVATIIARRGRVRLVGRPHGIRLVSRPHRTEFDE
jgi:hypothetical protein